ncbi:hypothetical protein [Methylobacterium trifolii]|uniref:Uncharacterized protein n=1 Tax=Methylobacterium trifolii TaxID=1003092 RepID=A0ABQ4U2B4_9HYPH|nr:hypothetical protein [Methylobacterium trifolii]GJE61406.1 hypothetical protein MPOCJGCO_3528 [Methylobacterium trifolii]
MRSGFQRFSPILLGLGLIGLATAARAEPIPGATGGAGTGELTAPGSAGRIGAGPAPGTPSGVVGFDGPPGGPANVTGGAGALPPGAPATNTGVPPSGPGLR